MMKRVLCILSNMNAGGAETFLMKMYRKIDLEKFQLDFCINSLLFKSFPRKVLFREAKACSYKSPTSVIGCIYYIRKFDG